MAGRKFVAAAGGQWLAACDWWEDGGGGWPETGGDWQEYGCYGWPAGAGPEMGGWPEGGLLEVLCNVVKISKLYSVLK
ncbi:hypothetical protein GBA52_003840 [Prunus armeniaca]|nr:hypothetical protein GBA52_003840 [Prunus armeniaca]